MRLLSMVIILVFLLLVSGCSEKLNEFKEAALEIDTTAEKAAKAISLDAHAIREIELVYNDETFTINTLFKTILRDVQWEYEEFDNIQRLKVKGNWQEPIFEKYITSDQLQEELTENGMVTIQFEFIDGQINPKSTSYHLILNNKTIAEDTGEDAYNYLLEFYTSL